MLTRRQLENYPLRETAVAKYMDAHGTKTASKAENIFVSHSHRDKDIILEFATFIRETFGASLYIDWMDETMPEKTNAETANKLKAKIRDCGKFLLLATDYSLNSRWVPWELGIADQMIGMDQIAVWPLVDRLPNWESNEYVSLYSLVHDQTQSGDYAVFKPGATMGTEFGYWVHN